MPRRNPYHDSINNVEVTEQDFKNDIITGMEIEIKHPSCSCEFCQKARKKFKEEPEAFLEEYWQDYLERKNYKPTEEELTKRKERLEEFRKKGWLV